jgi:peroxiredoxin
MATSTMMLELGTQAPPFGLPDVRTGETVSLGDFADAPVLLVFFTCTHCPYVKHVADELTRLGEDYAGSDVAIVAIASNDPGISPDDSPEGLAADADERGYAFPVLFDAGQDVAAAYTAACTPDFFLFDAERRLRYRGRLDASRPNSGTPVTGEDLRGAIEALRTGGEVTDTQYPSAGCSIKWRPENTPAYAG